MAEDDEPEEESEEETPSVELGEGAPVEGAPPARIASRLTWPQEQSEIDRKEGESVIRTPDGPRTVSEVLEKIDESYFARRQDFLDAVRAAVGTGPVPTE